jgi:DNA-binding NarL/FixJ family response regulator
MGDTIKTKEIAQIAGIHENTVRKYFSQFKMSFGQYDRAKCMAKISDMQERRQIEKPDWITTNGGYT